MGARSGASVHGWVYGLQDGLLRDLSVSVTSEEYLSACFDAAGGIEAG